MRTHLLLQTLIHATLISIVSVAFGPSAQAQGLPSYGHAGTRTRFVR
jgi:hypothetical protein